MKTKLKTLRFAAVLVVVVMAVFGCRSQNVDTSYQTMISKQWRLVSIVNDQTGSATKPPVEATIIFSDSSTFSGNSGCNGYFGVFLTDDSEIAVEVSGRSMAMCEHMDFEDKYVNLLDGCTTFFALGDELQLNNDELGVTLKFDEII